MTTSLGTLQQITGHYITENKKNTISPKAVEFLRLTEDLSIHGPKYGEIPQWEITTAQTDSTLKDEGNKNECPVALLCLFRQKLELYSDSVHLYTDASKHLNGLVGMGYLKSEAYHIDVKKIAKIK